MILLTQMKKHMDLKDFQTGMPIKVKQMFVTKNGNLLNLMLPVCT